MHLQRPVFPQLIVTFGFLSRTVLSFDSLSLPTYATKKKTKLYLSSFSGVYSREESEILGLEVSDNKRIRQASVDRSLSRNKVKVNNHRTLKTTIPSGQNQLPFVWKVAKGIHEESLIWSISLICTLFLSVLSQSSLPFLICGSLELLFLVHCTFQLKTKLNIPQTPEKILRSDWNEVSRLVWSSQRGVEASRSFLMGWMYDAPFEQLRREDALSCLAWMKHGLPLKAGLLAEEDINKLIRNDLVLLEKNVNGGKPLPLRKPGEEPLPIIRFNCEPLRYRHKSILFYVTVEAIHYNLRRTLAGDNFVYVPAKDPKKDIAYWYMIPDNEASEMHSSPIVFVHGVGGLAFCHGLIKRMKVDSEEQKRPIILLDLPHVSLRMHSDIPDISAQIDSICKMLDDTCGANSKATFVGHSFGSILLSWMVQKKPGKVAGCVFLDPICFQLHRKDLLFNFHLQRVDRKIQEGKKWLNPFSIDSIINLAGTEMNTNHAMLRKFSWATNSLWPEDLVKEGIPAAILLSENDEIVPTSEVCDLFQDFDESFKNAHGRKNNLIKTHVFPDGTHGSLFLDETFKMKTVETILNLKQEQGVGEFQ